MKVTEDTTFFIVKRGDEVHNGYRTGAARLYPWEGHARHIANKKNNRNQRALNSNAGYNQETGQAHPDAEARIRADLLKHKFYLDRPESLEYALQNHLSNLAYGLRYNREPWEVVEVRIQQL